MKNICMALVTALMMTLTKAHAADFQKGFDAYNAGDYATALIEFGELAEQGNAIAQHNLGVMYGSGKGIAQDHTEEVKWYMLAAEQGHTIAQYNLGVKYFRGQGVVQDYAEAVKWFVMAAEKGYAGAQFNLGAMYYTGEGVTQDYAAALKWFSLAAEQAHAEAQDRLGIQYAYGEGVKQDYILAHMWANTAAANGNEDGPKLRDYVAKEMAHADVSNAQRMARECMESNYENCGY